MNLTLVHVSKAYGDNAVLVDFCHAFREGRITVIEGRSGCGKTTLLRLIAGLEPPDAGTIEGVERDSLSMVFQEDRLPPQLTAADCLRAVLKRSAGRDGRIDAALAALGLGEALDKPVSEFSGGMRRRVALARALLYPSRTVLLDEPFKGLDADTRRRAVDFARPLLAGRTTLFVTHDPADAAAFDADRLSLSKP